MKIIWTKSATDSLTEILDYIAESNPLTALKFIEAINEKVLVLKDFPLSGRIVPEFDDPKLRELIHGNYRIIYRNEKNEIIIVVVRHSKRKLWSELKD